MQSEQSKHREDVEYVDSHRGHKQWILVPNKNVGVRILCCRVQNQRIYKTQNCCNRLHVNQYLDQLYVGSLGNSCVYDGDERDEGQSQGGYYRDSARKRQLLEEDQQSYETQYPKRHENLDQTGTWMLIKWNSEVNVAKLVDFGESVRWIVDWSGISEKLYLLEEIGVCVVIFGLHVVFGDIEVFEKDVLAADNHVYIVRVHAVELDIYSLFLNCPVVRIQILIRVDSNLWDNHFQVKIHNIEWTIVHLAFEYEGELLSDAIMHHAFILFMRYGNGVLLFEGDWIFGSNLQVNEAFTFSDQLFEYVFIDFAIVEGKIQGT